MRTVAIIQARMGSTRLTGKVLMPLAGKPVLWHIIHRLRKCRHLDAIAIATSTSSADDAIEEFAVREGIEVVRGSEDNVLARYALAAEKLGAEIIVRVTGDAPLADPVMIDLLVGTVIENEVDYCLGDPQVPCIHEGFSAFTFRALQKLVHEAADDPVAKEHVTAYFKKHPEFVRVAYVSIDPDYQFSGGRISVDTPADLRFLEEIYARLKAPAGEADVRDVVRLLRAEPDLLKINAHVHQKSPDELSRKVFFRCDGDSQLGLGHIYRCLALADELRDEYGCGVSFAMARGAAGFDLVQQAGYSIKHKPDDEDEDSWLDGVIRQLQPDVLVLDVRSDLFRSTVERWRGNGLLIVTIDDPSDRRLAADLAFYPPVPQLQKLDWTGFTGQLYVGWEWVVLRKEFAEIKNKKAVNNKSTIVNQQSSTPKVLVTMGGSDPQGMTIKAVKALEMLEENFEAVVILGAGFQHKEELDNLLSHCVHKYDVRENVEKMAELMAQADLAVASFGVTAYELAAMGVPAVYLCLTDDHAESASAFVEEGMAISLGVFTHVNTEMIARGTRNIINNKSLLSELADNARKHIDGRGVTRISRLMTQRLKAGNE